MTNWYGKDLAFIHDDGFKEFALRAAPGILDLLRRARLVNGLVVDLGCGSGLWARELLDAGYHVLGIDISKAMIALARKRAAAGKGAAEFRAEFHVASLFDADLPPCQAVTSIGECFNYLFDAQHHDNPRPLAPLFRRVFDALQPGGCFLFDILEPGQVDGDAPMRHFTEGDDWLVLVEKQEDSERQLLTRRIISFRKIAGKSGRQGEREVEGKAGQRYRRADETHIQRLYRATDIADELRHLGFRVRIARRYGDYALRKAHTALIARKP